MRKLGFSFVILCAFALFHSSTARIYQKGPTDQKGLVASEYTTRSWYPDATSNYPWDYGTTRSPYEYGTTRGTWDYGTTAYPWNYGTSNSPWEYGTSRSPYDYGTTGYPWNYGTSERPWEYGTSRSPWDYGTTRSPYDYGTTANPSNGQCPDGFIVLNEKKCVKLITTPMTYSSASNYCQNLNGGAGYLVSIHNAIDNRALVRLATTYGDSQPIWIGLNCTVTGAPSYCQWVDGSGYGYDYSNFANGNPFTDIGQSVYMLTSGASQGKWISGDGDISLGFICEAPVSVQSDCSNPFNGYCYDIHLTPESDSANSRTICQRECADVVSIHSQEENHHILSIFSRLPTHYYTKNYIRIGGFTDGIGKYWLDGSKWDYSNLGYFNVQVGSCMAMAIRDDIVSRGSWMSNNCGISAGFVCKRREGAKC